MKKIVLFVIILFPVVIFGKEFYDPSVNLTMNVDNYIVLTRDNLNNNSDLEKLGINKEEMEKTMINSSIYFDIIPSDLSHEILVIIPEGKVSINNLANAPTSFINELGDKLAKNVGIEKSIVYNKNKYVFLVRDYYDSKSGYYILNYFTAVNARGYNFQLQKSTSITDEEKDNFKKMIDSSNIEILDEYKYESEEVNKALSEEKKSGIDWGKVLIKSLVGAIVGGLGSLIVVFINKKRNQV